MADEKKLTPPQWLGRPILHDDHVNDLETRAAINEFHHKMPRNQAEQLAHEGYVKEQRERAAAHHLAGMKAAMATGNHEDARKHWALYDLHLKSLGKESIGAVPPEIEKRMMEDGGAKPVYKFKAHKGDLYALHEPSKDQAPAQGQPIQKAEAKQCKWRLGERRCQRMVTSGYCHDHVDHWANKIKQKEASEAPAEMEKADMPPAGTAHLQAPQLHGSVEGFMGALKALPKGDPSRGKLITQHMNHGPFLAALKQHPQGAQIHQMLTQHLNSAANAGFKAGATKVMAKAEARELATQLLKGLQTLLKGSVIQFPGNPNPKQKLPKGQKATVTPIQKPYNPHDDLDGYGKDYTHVLQRHGLHGDGHRLTVERRQSEWMGKKSTVYLAKLWSPNAEDHKDYIAEGSMRHWPEEPEGKQHNYEGFADMYGDPDTVSEFEPAVQEALRHASGYKGP